MTHNTGNVPPRSGGDRSARSSMTGAARDEAANVGQSVREAGGQVAETATEQAKEVVSETRRQARDLLGEARRQAREQGLAQQHKAAEQLRTLADELNEMAARAEQPGMVAELAQQASERIGSAASWLEKREPGDLFDGIRNFARRRPGAFLLGAAVAGVVAGRLTRGVAAAAGSDRQPGPPVHPVSAATPGPGAPTLAEPAATPPVPGYNTAGDSGPAAGRVAGGGTTTSGYPSDRRERP
jgi:hypothetical protein